MSEAHRALLEAVATGKVTTMPADSARWMNTATHTPISNTARKWMSWHQYALVRPSGEVSLTTAGLRALTNELLG